MYTTLTTENGFNEIVRRISRTIHERNRKIQQMIVGWGNQFFSNDEADMQELYSKWRAEAEMLKLEMPSENEVCNHINHQAINAYSFFTYFDNRFVK